jgi:hypothetical protein
MCLLFLCLRAIIIIASIGQMMTGLSYCPIGQDHCDTVSDIQTDVPTCVLACNVPLQQDAAVPISFAGKVSSVNVPASKGLAGLLIEPAVPPPRNRVLT